MVENWLYFKGNPCESNHIFRDVKARKRQQMKHELKVILGDSTANTLVLVDNQPIGLIQEIKIHAGVHQHSPEVEIVFPNLRPFASSNKSIVDELEKTLKLLAELPQVKVTLQEIKFDET